MYIHTLFNHSFLDIFISLLAKFLHFLYSNLFSSLLEFLYLLCFSMRSIILLFMVLLAFFSCIWDFISFYFCHCILQCLPFVFVLWTLLCKIFIFHLKEKLTCGVMSNLKINDNDLNSIAFLFVSNIYLFIFY